MNKNNLVVLKTTEPLFWEGEHFVLNNVYRCLNPTESGSDGYLIYGYWFTQEEFDTYFEYAYDRVIRDWTELGFVGEGGKPISYNLFKSYMDMHLYGKQTDNLRLGFVGVPKSNFYKFYPIGFYNKSIQLRQLYDRHYKETLSGNMLYLDCGKIKFGTFGISISYF